MQKKWCRYREGRTKTGAVGIPTGTRHAHASYHVKNLDTLDPLQAGLQNILISSDALLLFPKGCLEPLEMTL
jgi:hypothetical protein